MNFMRTTAYAAITAGVVAIGVSATAIINGSPGSEPITRVQVPPIATLDSGIAERPERVLVQGPAVTAGFRAYQDADGNFVAPPPGTVLPEAPKLAAVPGAQWRTSVAGGGFGQDTRGYRMSQRAVVTVEDEVVVECDPEQSSGHDHADAEGEH